MEGSSEPVHERAREVAWLVQCLSFKHEDLNSDPQHPHEKANMTVCACNPSAWEVEKAPPWSSLTSRPSQSGELRIQEKTLPRKLRWKQLKKTLDIHLCPLYTCVYIRIHTYIHTYTHTHAGGVGEDILYSLYIYTIFYYSISAVWGGDRSPELELVGTAYSGKEKGALQPS